MFQNRPLSPADDTARLLFSRYGTDAVEMAEARCRQLAAAGASHELASWKQILASLKSLTAIETREQLVFERQVFREALAIRPTWFRISPQIVFDGLAIGTAIVGAIQTPHAILGLTLFVSAWVVLTGRFFVLREHSVE